MSDKKHAVVTGAGSGIGQAVALRLLQSGYRVSVIGRRAANLEETATKGACDGARLSAFAVDVLNREALVDTFSHMDRVDALVVNAGVCKRTPLADAHSDDLWDEVIDTNLNGVWNTFRAAFPVLSEGAAIVAMSSGLGKLGRPGYGAYAASKHAVLGLVKCLAPELAPRRIRVNAVCPGWVSTDMAEADLRYTAQETNRPLEAIRQEALDRIPLRRFVTPEETAALIYWLLSEEASAITGQSYNISCGEFNE